MSEIRFLCRQDNPVLMKDAGASRIELLLYKKQLALLSDTERAELESLLRDDPVAMSLYASITTAAQHPIPAPGQNHYLRKTTLTSRTKVLIAVILLLLAMLPFW